MAMRSGSGAWLSGLVVALVAATLVGCKSANPQFVDKLPPPNFDGPKVAPQASQPLPPLPMNPTRRQPQVASGVPREWIPAAGASRPWRWIVIHHSATPSGSARTFDRMHREKGWDELGYHFVIGNGTETADGHVEVGARWPRQKWGAHAKTADNRFNDFGIGICLVGNFDLERPTAQQTRALARLVAHLMSTYNVPPERVLGHGETKPTECPGRNMSIASVRRMASQLVASGDAIEHGGVGVLAGMDQRGEGADAGDAGGAGDARAATATPGHASLAGGELLRSAGEVESAAIDGFDSIDLDLP